MTSHSLLDALSTHISQHTIRETLDIDELLALHHRDLILRCHPTPPNANQLRVFGIPLHQIILYASTTVLVSGHKLRLPIVVYACVEELYRSGMNQNGLFRVLPNHERHLQLIHQFDTSGHDSGKAPFGRNTELHSESMPDVCAVLSTYISSLPEPVLCAPLFDAFWVWCVKPTLELETLSDTRSNEPNRDRPLHTDEDKQITIAQILFHFLPSPNFSLLFYLFSFFAKIPFSGQNKLQFEDLALLFASKLLGGPKKMLARRMFVWILRRWIRISDGLVPSANKVPMRARMPEIPSPCVARRSWTPQSPLPMSATPPDQNPGDGIMCAPKDDSYDPLAERLLDIMPPQCLKSDTETEFSPDAGTNSELARRTWELERALERSEDACTAAIRDAFAAQRQASELQARVDALEALPREKDESRGLLELESKIRVLQAERDEALRLLDEIKKVLRGRMGVFLSVT